MLKSAFYLIGCGGYEDGEAFAEVGGEEGEELAGRETAGEQTGAKDAGHEFGVLLGQGGLLEG